MDQQDTQSSTPVTPPLPETPAVSTSPFPQAEPSKKTSGVFIAAAILLLIVLGGILFFLKGNPMSSETLPPVVTDDGKMNGDGTTATKPDPTVEKLSQQGSSDEIADIEADLNATDLNAASADVNSF